MNILNPAIAPRVVGVAVVFVMPEVFKTVINCLFFNSVPLSCKINLLCNKYKNVFAQVHWGVNQTLIWSQLTVCWV